MRSVLIVCVVCAVAAGSLGLAAGRFSNSALNVRAIDILDEAGNSVIQLRGTKDGGEIRFSDADDEQITMSLSPSGIAISNEKLSSHVIVSERGVQAQGGGALATMNSDGTILLTGASGTVSLTVTEDGPGLRLSSADQEQEILHMVDDGAAMSSFRSRFGRSRLITGTAKEEEPFIALLHNGEIVWHVGGGVDHLDGHTMK